MPKKEIIVYTLTELTESLGISRRTVYNWIKSGKLKAIKVGQQWRVTEDALNDFLQKGTEEN